jgi:hypothetical protein
MVEHVEGGSVYQRATYRSLKSAWHVVDLWYGVTLASVRAALASGDQVERPALMSPSPPSWATRTYVRVWDFDTDVKAVRRSVQFAVPMAGPALAGLRIADVERIWTRGPGLALDWGLAAWIEYSSAPARHRSDDRELILNVYAASQRAGADSASLFRRTPDRLVGPGYDARLVDQVHAILRYRGSYVVVVAERWGPSRSQWRVLLQRIAQH